VVRHRDTRGASRRCECAGGGFLPVRQRRADVEHVEVRITPPCTCRHDANQRRTAYTHCNAFRMRMRTAGAAGYRWLARHQKLLCRAGWRHMCVPSGRPVATSHRQPSIREARGRA